MGRRGWHAILVLVGIVLVSIVWGETAFRVRHVDVRSEGPNAMWLGHTWVGDRHSKAEYEELANRLQFIRATDAYVHVGPLRGDGIVGPKRYLHAPDLLKNISTLNPNIRLHAWLGQVEAKAGGPLDLANAKTRAAIVKTSCEFLDMGFDGVHYDIEPIYSGDPHFLRLLSVTHKETSSRHKMLSVAASKPEPVGGLAKAAGCVAEFPGYWTRDYFLRVAERCDQVAIMAYDTAVPLPSVYVGLVSWMTRWAAHQDTTTVLIGVPTYDGATGSHYPYVENLDNALSGVKRGLVGLPLERRKKIGTAIYAQWTTSDAELGVYKCEWVDKYSGRARPMVR